MIVVDASVMIEVLVRPNKATSFLDRLLNPAVEVHAPHLIDVEVAQVIRRFVRAGEIDAERGETIIDDLLAFPMERHSHEYLLPRIWQLRDNLSAYDATYAALAECLGAPLMTCDQRLSRAVGHFIVVELA